MWSAKRALCPAVIQAGLHHMGADLAVELPMHARGILLGVHNTGSLHGLHTDLHVEP